MREVAEPKQIAEFRDVIKPRDHRVFFGKLDRGRLGLVDRLVANLPAFPGTEGDFRDWNDVDAWAERIAIELTQVPDLQRAAR
jgi:menaquinone-dependent protoporphyrinogen oxidase